MSYYHTISGEQLDSLLFTEEDRLPREAVDEFVRRADSVIPRLSALVSDPGPWNEPRPSWWAPIHGVFILGAIGTPAVLAPLLVSLRHAESHECEWVTRALPGIFGSIGTAAREPLERIAADETSGWAARAAAVEALAAIALTNPAAEARIFSTIRQVFSNRNEDLLLRRAAGHVLLDFLRAECREELIVFGREERRLLESDRAGEYAFTDDQVVDEFGRGERLLTFYAGEWLRFYDPREIAKRQRKWREEDAAATDSVDGSAALSHALGAVNGESELCPFGKEQKRKRCCLGRVEIA